MPYVVDILVWMVASAGAVVWACRYVNRRLASGFPLDGAGGAEIEGTIDDDGSQGGIALRHTGIDGAPPVSADMLATQDVADNVDVPASNVVGGTWSTTPYAWHIRCGLLAAALFAATMATAVAVANSVTDGSIVTPSVYVQLLIGYAGVLASAVTDVKLRVIPNAIPIAMLGVRAPLLVYQWLALSPALVRNATVSSVVGLVGSFVLLMLVGLVTHGGIGGGDIKLISALGFACGFVASCASLMAGLLVFGVAAAVLLAMRRRKLRDSLPFAPFLYIGLVVVLVSSLY